MLKIVTPPTVEPVTLEEVMAQAVIDGSLEDMLLEIDISAARAHGEALTNRSWAPQTLEVVLDGFPAGRIKLPRGPVTTVVSAVYLDVNGAEVTLDQSLYDANTEASVAWVAPVYGGSWPVTANKPNAVRVRYKAGWPTSGFPPALKLWMLISVASFCAQRENHIVGYSVGMKVASMPRGFCDSLLDPFILPEGL